MSYLLTGHHRLQDHPFGRVVSITAAHNTTVWKWLPTLGLQGERYAPAVETNTSNIMSTVTNKILALLRCCYYLSNECSGGDVVGQTQYGFQQYGCIVNLFTVRTYLQAPHTSSP